MKPVSRRRFLSTSAIIGSSLFSPALLAQESREKHTEPVYVAKVNNAKLSNYPEPHPLDPALQMAQSSLQSIRSSIRDYTAILVKREEDKNGDGNVDVTSIYKDGKLVKREITDPSLVPL